MKKISIIVPCFNEQEVIEQTYGRLAMLSLPDFEKELIFIDDGSRDRTPEILKGLAEQDSQVKVLLFAKNFGHQPAVSAGIAHCTGDAAVVIDSDLQDPPELIPEMIEKWQAGNDIVYGKRAKRKGETIFKNLLPGATTGCSTCLGAATSLRIPGISASSTERFAIT